MASSMPAGERTAWEEELAGRLLTAVVREAVLADSSCPSCDRRLTAEPVRRAALAAVTLTEGTTLRCPRCGFKATADYRELRAYDLDRTVVIDGRVIRTDHRTRPSHEVSGLDEAGDIIW